MADIIIIGGGHAAAQAVLSLKQAKFDGTIALISAEDFLPYQRPPLSKAYLKGQVQAERLPIHRQKLYDDMQVALYLGQRAEKIDRQEKNVTLSSGEILPYGHLILATGGEARRLSIPGAGLHGIHYVRQKADVDHMQAAWSTVKNIAIIGGGYIGLEVAAAAIDAGKKVTLLESEDRLLKRVTAPIVSEFYADYHRAKGVDIKLGSQVVELLADEKGEQVNGLQSQDGTSITADMVIVGIGLEPNSQLAEVAGLEVHPAGITVNDFAQTSDPAIYAVGDVSWHHNRFYDRWMRLESVQNAVDQTKVAVGHILGGSDVYDAQPWFWSEQYDLKLQTVGLSEGYDNIVERGDSGAGKVAYFYLKEGCIIAADCINMMAEFMQAKKLIAARQPVSPDQLLDPRPFKEVAQDLLGQK